MGGLNRVQLIGFLGKDPEMRIGRSTGAPYCRFPLATQEWKGEVVEWHNIVLFKRLAEVADQFLKKGSQVYVEGRIKTNIWNDPEGKKRTRVEIVAMNLQMLDRKDRETAPEFSDPAAATMPTAVPADDNPFDADDLPDFDEDIPF